MEGLLSCWCLVQMYFTVWVSLRRFVCLHLLFRDIWFEVATGLSFPMFLKLLVSTESVQKNSGVSFWDMPQPPSSIPFTDQHSWSVFCLFRHYINVKLHRISVSLCCSNKAKEFTPRPAVGLTQNYMPCVLGFLPRGQSAAQGVTLTTLPHHVSRLKASRSSIFCPHKHTRTAITYLL